MKNNVMKVTLGLVIVVVSAVVAWTFVARSQEREEEQEKMQPGHKTGPANGVTLDVDTQSRLGIHLASLTRSSHRSEFGAPAVVLSAQDLIDLRNSYLNARAKADKGRLNMDASQREYDRIKALYQDNQNASQKSLQAAEVALRSNEVDLQSAEQELRLIEDTASQRWGDVVASWLEKGSPHFDLLLQQTEFLVQVTLPTDDRLSAPQQATLEASQGQRVSAELVSRFPRVDSSIQGRSFLYLTRARDWLLPGVTLTARLPAGKALSGVTIPESAVVWWQGKAWAYVQTASDHFERREVPTDAAVPNGWFVANGFSGGEKVVVTGAQALLSAELRPQAAAEGNEGAEGEEKERN
jgi:multidrug efflux pump subunit AcrA (membrane-fusion protein)